jgi:glycosyltransferase involved in cell wall biosynthesis
MARTRVAFFAEILIDDFDGASRTIFHIINRIPKSDYDYTFFCGVPPSKAFEFDVHTVPTFTIPINKTYKIALPLWAKRRIIKTLEAIDPQVIHISTPSPLGELALAYAVQRGIPVITIYHTHFVSYVQFYLQRLPWAVGSIERYIQRRLMKFYNQCDIIYAPTSVMRQALESYGIEAKRIKLWPRALNEGVFDINKKDPAFKHKYGLDGHPVILYASRLVWEKNVSTLIEIYKQATIRYPDYRFVVVGDGVASDEMKRQMPHAIFLGHLSHDVLSIVYASVDVYVFTSITETYGNVVIEAMASGLPCVIANGGGSASIIDHGVNGFLAQYDDPTDYLSCIAKILDDNPLRHRFVTQGLAYTAQLSWKSLIDSYFMDIQSLAD